MPVGSETVAEPVVTLTPAAVQRVKQLIARKAEPGLALRLGVKGGGCSGLSYVMALDDRTRPGDLVWEVDGVAVWVDPKSARFMAGTTVDYSTKNILDGGFQFHNPNASRTCGCGTSFQPRK